MKPITNNTILAVFICIIGIAIVVGGILTMALYHDMSWQSYVIIGVIMLCAIWAMLNLPFTINMRKKKEKNQARRSPGLLKYFGEEVSRLPQLFLARRPPRHLRKNI